MDTSEGHERRREPIEGRSILIVDLEDEPLFTHSLGTALEDAGAECRVVPNEEEAYERAASGAADVAIVDLEFPHSRVAEVGRAIHEQSPQAAVVVLGTYYDSRFALEVMRYGFRGYLTKEISLAGFIGSIGKALSGEVVLAPSSSRRPNNLLTADQLEALRRAEQLTHREREVLALLAHGADGRQIGRTLLISKNTVNRHIQNVLSKLEVHSRLEAATFSRRFGIDGIPHQRNGSSL